MSEGGARSDGDDDHAEPGTDNAQGPSPRMHDGHATDDDPDHANPDGDVDDTDENDLDDESVAASSQTKGPPSQSVSSVFPQARMRKLQRRMNVIVRWEKMLSCVAISGNIRLNARQYSFLVRALRNANPDIALKQYKAVTGTFWKKILAHGLPRSAVYSI